MTRAGSASACGAPPADLAAIRGRVEARLGEFAASTPDSSRAWRRYEEAFARGNARARRAGKTTCPADLDRLRVFLRDR